MSSMIRSMHCLLATILLLAPIVISCEADDDLERVCLDIGFETSSIIIRDFEYDRYRFFDLGLVGDTNVLGPGDTIVSITLFRSNAFPRVPDPLVDAYANWLSQDSTTLISDWFREIDIRIGDYLVDPVQHFLFFPHPLYDIKTQALAYRMEYIHQGERYQIGALGTGTAEAPHQLQLLKAHRPDPDGSLWWAEWKNVYDLGMRHINHDDLDLKIYKGQLGDEENLANLDHEGGMRYLRLLGLDQEDAGGNPGPDNRVDLDPAILDTSRGLLFFPDRLPFADSTVLHEPAPSIYTSGNEAERQGASQYYIKMVTQKRSRTVPLGTVNIRVNSEVVTLNGRRLIRGTDYQIDYGLGEVTFLDEDALDPDASVNICYEFEPL